MRVFYRRSTGQIAVIIALGVVALVGAIGLGTDVALHYYNWALLQKAADGAALAGANYLPNDPVTASNTAINYAKLNGAASNEINAPTFSTGDTQINLSLHRTVPYIFGRVFGLTSGQVQVSATASIPYKPRTIGVDRPVGGPTDSGGSGGSGGSGSGGAGTPANPVCGNSIGQDDVIPIAVSNLTASAWVQGRSYTLNRTATGGNGPWVDAPGNWGMVSLCGGNGSGSTLRSSIADGFYGPISIGQTLTTAPGAKVGPVDQGFSDRIGASADSYPTFNPTDPRAVIVPMVSGFSICTGSCTVTVTGFLAFYIDSYSSGAITGHFISKVQGNSIGDPTVTGDAGTLGDPILIK